jgi:hypothetical protein
MLAAVYPDAAAANTAVMALNLSRLGEVRITQLAPGSGDIDLAIEAEPEQPWYRPAGAAPGDGPVAAQGVDRAGRAASTLFISPAVVGPLIVLGYAAILAGKADTSTGFRLQDGMLDGLLRDVLMAGCHVVIVRTANHESQRRTQAVICETMAE